MKNPKDSLQKAANAFGIDKLKPFQKKVCSILLDGHDVIALSGTGSGKSLCYQLPSYLHRNMLTIIITPVIALMRDQKQRWPDDVRVQCLYHGNPENKKTYHLLEQKKLSVLYLSPERLADPKICKALRENPIFMVVVDEVHCLMEWGNEFRPMYQQIGKFIRSCKSKPIIAAFSATVSSNDIPFIVQNLGMQKYRLHVGKLCRKNLNLKKKFVKTDAIRCEKVRKAVLKHRDQGKIIIYCTRIRDVQDMYEYLVEKCDLPADEVAICHSKLSNRSSEEERFRSGTAKIMVATSAFGMGIDIPDIRLVIVSQMPFSIASFYQMVGRAGRDGEKAHGLLLYNNADFRMNFDIISTGDEREMIAVDEMWNLCMSDKEIQAQVMDYFGWEEA